MQQQAMQACQCFRSKCCATQPYSHLFCVSHSQRTDRAMYERVLKDLNIRPLKKEV